MKLRISAPTERIEGEEIDALKQRYLAFNKATKLYLIYKNVLLIPTTST